MDTVSTTQIENGRRGYAKPRSMTTVRYRQIAGAGKPLVIERPGLQRFRNLPDPVAGRVLEFLDEVKQSNPEYSGAYSRAWRDFLQRFSLIFFEPFQSPRHFAPKEALDEAALMTYADNLIQALRPILHALRESGSEHENAHEEGSSTLELVVDARPNGETVNEAMRA